MPAIIAIIVLRLIYLAAFGDHAGRKGGAIDLTPERGDIVDRDGQALARTIDAWTIGLQPAKVIGNKLDLARKLAAADAREGRGDLSRHAPVGPQASIIFAAGPPPRLVAAINALGEPGLALEREPDRLYPQTSLAAHVVGYTDIDGKGNAGIERAFDEQLSRSGAARPADRRCRFRAGSSRRWSMSCASDDRISRRSAPPG